MPELHKVFLNLSSRKGDRLSNILQALQYIQIRAFIGRTSSFYESTSNKGHQKSLNRVCSLKTDLSLNEFHRHLEWVEKRISDREQSKRVPGDIEVNVLFFDDLVLNSKELTIPYPRLHETGCILKALAEIAPKQLSHPQSGVIIEEMLSAVDLAGLSKVDHGTALNLDNDAQQARPSISMSLSRVGVANLSRIILISSKGGVIPFQAELDLFADLHSDQAGIHMSRFSDDLEEIVQEFTLDPYSDIESLSERLARQVLHSQNAVYSEVHIRGKSALRKTTPVSGKTFNEVFTLIGIAAATKEHTRRLLGVESEGVTACPCAQEMMRSHSKNILIDEGFTVAEADRILNLLPVPSHNQRGRGTLIIGSKARVPAENLVRIVEASMSSEMYELLKRPDEFFVVNKAHSNPRFVEDVVREMLRTVVDVFNSLPDEAFVLAKQVNYEGIHKHDAYAERYGLLGELRRELRDGLPLARHTTLQDWLRG